MYAHARTATRRAERPSAQQAPRLHLLHDPSGGESGRRPAPPRPRLVPSPRHAERGACYRPQFRLAAASARCGASLARWGLARQRCGRRQTAAALRPHALSGARGAACGSPPMRRPRAAATNNESPCHLSILAAHMLLHRQTCTSSFHRQNGKSNLNPPGYKLENTVTNMVKH
jgi:hypothetical protein